MAPSARQLARSAFVFWVITTLTCTSQIALIAITIGLATNNASIEGSIHRTAWVTAAANMVALTASLGAVCLFVRRTERITYISLCTIIVLVSVLAALLTIYTLTWIWNYVRNMNHPNSRFMFTQTLSKAGFAVWSVSFIAQATLFTLVFWPKQQQIAPPTPQELTQRPSPGRAVKRRLSDLTSLTPPSTPPPILPKSVPSSPKFSSPTKSYFGHSVNQVIRPMTSKTKLLLRQQSFPRDSSSLQSTRETSLEALRQDDGFESWDTSRVEEADDGHFLPQSVRLRVESRLETIPGSRPVSPANPLNGPFPSHMDDDVRLPESPAHSPVHSPSSETSSFTFSPPPTRPDSSAGQSHIHPLFRSESPGPAPLASPGTVITASPFAGQVVNPDLHGIVPPRKLRSSHSFRADSPGPFSPSRSRQGSFRSVQTTQPQSSHGERSATPGSIRLVTSPEPDESSV
jgi:hypothetical protein